MRIRPYGPVAVKTSSMSHARLPQVAFAGRPRLRRLSVQIGAPRAERRPRLVIARLVAVVDARQGKSRLQSCSLVFASVTLRLGAKCQPRRSSATGRCPSRTSAGAVVARIVVGHVHTARHRIGCEPVLYRPLPRTTRRTV